MSRVTGREAYGYMCLTHTCMLARRTGAGGGRPSHVICTAYRRCQTSDDGGEISNCNRGRGHEPRATSSALAFKSDAAADIKYVFREDDEGGRRIAREGEAGAAEQGRGNCKTDLVLTWNRFRDMALYRRTYTAKLQ